MTAAHVTLTLIPGFMLDATLWTAVTPQLQQHWSVRHAALTGGESIPAIAQQIATDLPARSVLVGFSLGGYVAREIAGRYPERVAALILIASSLREDSAAQQAAKQAALQMASPERFSGLSSKTIRRFLHPDHAEPTLIARIQQMGVGLGYAAFVTQSRLNRAEGSTAPIRCPTLVVAAAQDETRSLTEAQELVERIPQARLAVIEHSGHLIPLEQPEVLGRLIRQWLAGMKIAKETHDPKH